MASGRHQPATDPFAKTLNELPKYVVSTTLSEPLDWQNSRPIKTDVTKEIAKLKEQPGKNTTALGSGELVPTLIRHDLVDGYGLMINPIVLVSGERFFRAALSTRSSDARPHPPNSLLVGPTAGFSRALAPR